MPKPNNGDLYVHNGSVYLAMEPDHIRLHSRDNLSIVAIEPWGNNYPEETTVLFSLKDLVRDYEEGIRDA